MSPVNSTGSPVAQNFYNALRRCSPNTHILQAYEEVGTDIITFTWIYPQDLQIHKKITHKELHGHTEKTLESLAETWGTEAEGRYMVWAYDYTLPHRINTNRGHGWVHPRPDRHKELCGGPAICNECLREQESLTRVTARRILGKEYGG